MSKGRLNAPIECEGCLTRWDACVALVARIVDEQRDAGGAS
jgi:hypothetical protein